MSFLVPLHEILGSFLFTTFILKYQSSDGFSFEEFIFVCIFPGHAHLTDFNIATIIKDGERATALAGTKPYMGNFHLELHHNYLSSSIFCDCETSDCFLRINILTGNMREGKKANKMLHSDIQYEEKNRSLDMQKSRTKWIRHYYVNNNPSTM